jgi:hypothetical protein
MRRDNCVHGGFDKFLHGHCDNFLREHNMLLLPLRMLLLPALIALLHIVLHTCEKR